jgi:two-component system response regulator DevR
MARIRVLLVDDHELVRLGLRTALEVEPDVAVVGEAGDAAEALRQVAATGPDVVLMDVVMPGQSGIEACREIRAAHPRVQVLMLTSYSDDAAVFSSIMAGAAGYLLKNTGRADIVRAVRSVARGEALLDPAVTRKVTDRLTQLARAKEVEEIEPLTEREREVLALVARGLTNKEIADRLVISEKTARNHISHILEKLNLSRRSEAAAYAVRKNIVPSDPPKD